MSPGHYHDDTDSLKLADALCDRAERRFGPDLFFFAEGALSSQLSHAVLREFARSLESDCVLLSENDPPGPARDEFERIVPIIYRTHALGDPDEWGWHSVEGVLRKLDPDELARESFHALWDCEASLLLVGPFALIAEHLAALPSRVPLGADGLAILSPIVRLAIGNSTHSGDFLWRPHPLADSG